MSREDVDKNYKEMLLIVNKFREDKLTLAKAIEALQPLSINKDVVVEIYNTFLDRKDIDRENLMMVICEMLKTNKLSRDVNRAALIDTMESAPDMLCDVPLTYEYIGQFFGKSCS
jgi:MA3 domain